MPDPGPAVTSLLGRVDIANIMLEEERASKGDNLIHWFLNIPLYPDPLCFVVYSGSPVEHFCYMPTYSLDL